MHLWHARFSTLQPFATLPMLLSVASEEVFSPSYHHEGRRRLSEQHCIYKYTLSGEGRFRDARGEHAVPVGHGFLCRINDPDVAYYFPAEGRGPWRFVYMSFAGEQVRQTVAELTARYGGVFALPAEHGVVARLTRFAEDDGAVREMTPAEGAEIVNGLLLSLVAGREVGLRETPENLLVRTAMQFVRDHLEEPLNVTRLAQRMRVSREHLTRLFQQQTGTTPLRYIRRERMLLACRLLLETTLTGKEISVRVGYPDPAHFARSFRQVVGMSPGVCRERGTMPVLL